MPDDSPAPRKASPTIAWPLLVAWLLLSIATTGVFDAALETSLRSFYWVTYIGIVAMWFGGILAILVPRPVTLTVIRIAAPATLAATAWAAEGLAVPKDEVWIASTGVIGTRINIKIPQVRGRSRFRIRLCFWRCCFLPVNIPVWYPAVS